MQEYKYAIVVIKRMWKKLFHRPIHLVVSFIQPIFWLSIFGYLFKDKFQLSNGNYLSYLFAGVCAMTIMQSAAQSGIAMVKDLQSGFFGRYNYSKQSKFSILFFKIFADYTRVFVQLILLFMLALFMHISGLEFNFIKYVLFFLAAFLFFYFYASISCYLALRFKASELLATFIHLFNLPILFTSTALVPNKNVPSWISSLAEFNPLSHLSDVLRANIMGDMFPLKNTAFSWWYLSLLAGMFFLWALNYLRKKVYD